MQTLSLKEIGYDYYKYYSTDCIVRKSFSPLEIDCSYPISSESALEIASEYWEVSDWDYDCATGTTIVDRIVLSSKPSDENRYYRIIWKREDYWHAYPCWEGQTPITTYIRKSITLILIYIEPENKKIKTRKAYFKISSLLREFVYYETDIKTHTFSLEEIKEINMPELYEIIEEIYNPEFSKYSDGDVIKMIKKVYGVIKKWNS